MSSGVSLFFSCYDGDIQVLMLKLCSSGGTVGWVIASIVDDARSDLCILLIEEGPDNYNVPSVTFPAFYRADYAPGRFGIFNWQGEFLRYETKPLKGLMLIDG
jgi:hypothetical protein